MKAAGKRKTRLAEHLNAIGRQELSEQLFHHVIQTLKQCPSIARLIILSDSSPLIDGVEWIADEDLGLNAELERARAAIGAPMVIIHADLPLLGVSDVEALLSAAAQDGIAIAPDDHGKGTNALALHAEHAMTLAFGANSFALHHAQAPLAAIISDRPGLALDIDTVDDLDKAIRLGFSVK
jgi:2-phospho-L-lactate/phosphoenolpyruvate guanylyltransferase